MITEVGSTLIINADALTALRALDDQSVQCCVTSPPYYGLRDYGIAGQAGLEATPQAYVDNMVGIFREVRRVLRDDGTLWLNLGDSYAGSGKGGNPVDSEHQKQRSNAGSLSVIGNTAREAAKTMHAGECRPPDGLKPKDLIGIPWRVAFALQADGWYLRQDLIWYKRNPMPESVTDRCTKAHEYIFLMSKSPKYYYDAAAIAEPLASASIERMSQPNLENHAGSDRVPGKTNGQMKAVYTKPYTGESTKDYKTAGAQDASATKKRIVDRILSGEICTRNKRSVWDVTTKPYKGAHFATFPPDLIEPCILAGTSEKGACPHCGASWIRVENSKRVMRHELPVGDPNYRPARYTVKSSGADEYANGGGQAFRHSETVGWAPGCKCPTHDPVPCTVIDPFAGSGTTGMVAARHKRSAILMELNPAYVVIAAERLKKDMEHG